MLNIYLTVDVEIWPQDWDLSPGRCADYFNRYITGRTPRGDYGLAFQLRLLREHRLRAIFFVEPLFAYHFGPGPLRDIVAMIQAEGHPVALHPHTEWIGRTRRPIPPGRFEIQLRDYSPAEQVDIVRAGKEMLVQCGVSAVTAFRAGNFGANRSTLAALAANEIAFDSSYNAACKAGPFIDERLSQPTQIGDVVEYPVAVYRDGLGRLRHAQIGASSAREIIGTMQQARRTWTDFVIFWHSGEFLDRTKTRPDRIALRRYARLCEFLALHRDTFRTAHFGAVDADARPQPAAELRATSLDSLLRLGSQSLRRLWGS